MSGALNNDYHYFFVRANIIFNNLLIYLVINYDYATNSSILTDVFSSLRSFIIQITLIYHRKYSCRIAVKLK